LSTQLSGDIFLIKEEQPWQVAQRAHDHVVGASGLNTPHGREGDGEALGTALRRFLCHAKIIDVIRKTYNRYCDNVQEQLDLREQLYVDVPRYGSNDTGF
jgi:hypothetical protein